MRYCISNAGMMAAAFPRTREQAVRARVGTGCSSAAGLAGQQWAAYLLPVQIASETLDNAYP